MTLSLYMFRRFVVSVLVVTALLFVLYGLLDMIELVRRLKSADAGLLVVLAMTGLRTIEGAYDFLPFTILLATLTMFHGLSRSSELVVVRSVGRSILRLLVAPIVATLLIGLLAITTLNPIVAISKAEYDRLALRYFQGSTSVLSVSPDGLWLRQGSAREQTVIRAGGALSDGADLRQVTFYGFDTEGAPSYRIEAAAARLEPGAWRLEDYRKWTFDGTQVASPHPETGASMRLESPLTLDQIRDGLGTPASISFWSLPAFIDRLEQAGFSARRHMVWYQAELARPVLFVASMLIGAMLMMRQARARGGSLFIIATLLIGFGFFFLRNFAVLLGENGQLPITLAVWAVPVAAIMTAVAVILHLEDG